MRKKETIIKFDENKAYQCWLRWMRIGEKTGCHQIADRSFFIRGFQMPVCARCTGVILGYGAAIVIYILSGFHAILSIAGSLIMLIDWLLQAGKILISNNRRRLVTGILGGFGIMSIQLYMMKRAFILLRRMKYRDTEPSSFITRFRLDEVRNGSLN